MDRGIECGVHLHLIGIGGVGMSGIAEVLLTLGYVVSGSDIINSERTAHLEGLGVSISIGHRRGNVEGASFVVYTSAISRDNIELKACAEMGIPVMQRTQMLAELMRLKKGISVAGTHGKTTTTGILTTIIEANNLNPSYIIGGRAMNLQSHAKVGRGDYLIVEADESDGSFLLLNPIYSVVTNIDYDHMDFYKSKENLHEAFKNFLNKIPFYGLMALNIHDKNIRCVAPYIKKRWVSYGILEELEEGLTPPTVYASHVSYCDRGSSFHVCVQGENLGKVHINIPGNHNVLNALGAISLCHFMGIEFDSIQRGISLFKGMKRRFERVFEKDSFEVFDDYGHHPTEVSTTLKTFKMIRPNKKKVVIFEPHRFSRTKEHWNEFVHCFGDIDELYVLDIYPASERPIAGIHSRGLVRDMKKIGVKATYCEEDSFDQILWGLKGQEVTILTLGAGVIGDRIHHWTKNAEKSRW